VPEAGSYGGQSMAAPLRKVLVCPPGPAGWEAPEVASGWKDLGYHHPPDAAVAESQHAMLRGHLAECGAEVVELGEAGGLSLDVVYVRDSSLMTDHGAVCFNMGKALRKGEGGRHRAFYESRGIPVLGEITAPGTAEAGDMVWLDDRTLLVGRGCRTNQEGIRQLAQLLGPKGIQVVSAPLPWGAGPDSCFHLMSILSVPGERVALVDLPLMAVQTVELLQQKELTLVEIDPSERSTQAANVLSLGNGRLLAIEENIRTNGRLRAAGFQVLTFPGGEICQNGGGGPTCLTRPLLRG